MAGAVFREVGESQNFMAGAIFGDMGLPFETYSGPTWLVFQTTCVSEAGKVTTANGRVGD